MPPQTARQKQDKESSIPLSLQASVIGRLLERVPLFRGPAHKSGITKKHHEAKIHAALLMAME
jgi:hypothetical protein